MLGLISCASTSAWSFSMSTTSEGTIPITTASLQLSSSDFAYYQSDSNGKIELQFDTNTDVSYFTAVGYSLTTATYYIVRLTGSSSNTCNWIEYDPVNNDFSATTLSMSGSISGSGSCSDNTRTISWNSESDFFSCSTTYGNAYFNITANIDYYFLGDSFTVSMTNKGNSLNVEGVSFGFDGTLTVGGVSQLNGKKAEIQSYYPLIDMTGFMATSAKDSNGVYHIVQAIDLSNLIWVEIDSKNNNNVTIYNLSLNNGDDWLNGSSADSAHSVSWSETSQFFDCNSNGGKGGGKSSDAPRFAVPSVVLLVVALLFALL